MIALAAFCSVAAMPSAHAKPWYDDEGGGAMVAGILSILTSGPTLTLSGKAGKETLAQAALEDVAVYYETGRLTGVLPAVVAHLRESQGLNETQAIDAITELATNALEDNADTSGK